MYHLSGISSLTTRGRFDFLSSDGISPPLSPSVLDFSEYVSRQCEKKLQRRVRQLSQRCSKQLASIKALKRQLEAANGGRQPFRDVSNTATTSAAIARSLAKAEAVAKDDTADNNATKPLDGNGDEDEAETDHGVTESRDELSSGEASGCEGETVEESEYDEGEVSVEG